MTPDELDEETYINKAAAAACWACRFCEIENRMQQHLAAFSGARGGRRENICLFFKKHCRRNRCRRRARHRFLTCKRKFLPVSSSSANVVVWRGNAYSEERKIFHIVVFSMDGRSRRKLEIRVDIYGVEAPRKEARKRE